MSSERPTRISKQGIALLAGIVIIGLFARTYHYRQAFPDGRLSPYGVDPFYHMRRVVLTIESFPTVRPVYDYYIAYPKGGVCIWPPLFDLSIAGISKLLGFGNPGIGLIEHVAAFFPAFVGAGIIVLAFLLARRLFDLKTAYVTAALVAVIPANISVSMLGRVDHHVWDIFLSGAFLLLAMSAVSERSGRRLHALYAGLVLVAAFLSWHGTAFFVLVYLLFFSLEMIRSHIARRDCRPLAESVLISLAPALLILLPYSSRSPWMDNGMPYLGLSRFHAMFMLAAVAFVCYAWAVEKSCRARERRRSVMVLLLLALPIGVLFLIGAIMPKWLGTLRALYIYVGRTDPWLSTIAECQPAFFRLGEFDASFVEVSLTYAAYVFPAAFLFVLWQTLRSSDRRRERILFLVWTVSATALALAKRRFFGEFALVMCIALAYAGVQTISTVNSALSRRGVSPKGRAVFRAVVCGACVLLAWPGLSYFFPVSKKLYDAAPRFMTIFPDYKEAVLWLKKNTPPTSYYKEPEKMPEYGILAEWLCGEWIQCLGERPATANCMGTHLGRREPFEDSARFHFVEDEDEANGILSRLCVRYVMTAYFAKNLPNFSRIAGVDLQQYAVERRTPEGRLVFSLTPRYYRTMGSRLHERDGTAFRTPDGSGVMPLRHYRLIYEGSRDRQIETGFDLPSLKIFEFVKGAKLTGTAPANSQVIASVQVITNRGRRFRYVTGTTASARNKFDMVVPYSTQGCPFATKAVTSYTVACPSGAAQVEVPEKSVLEGGEILVALPGERRDESDTGRGRRY